MVMQKTAAGLLITALLVSFAACSSPQDQTTTTPPTTSPSTPSQTPIAAVAQLCVPNSNTDGFTTVDTMSFITPDGPGRDLIDQLVNEGALPAGVRMLSLNVDVDITVDMNAAYGEAVTNTGTSGEYLLVGTVVNTLLDFWGREFIFITIEGAPLKTSQAEYGEPLTFFIDQLPPNKPANPTDLQQTITNLPDPAAIANLYSYIGGYWNSTQGEFVGFTTHCGKPHVEFGIWDSEYGRSGAMTTATPTGQLSAELTLRLKAEPAWEGGAGYPLEDAPMTLDLTTYPTLKIGTPKLGNDELSTYTYAGATIQEAFDDAH